MKKIILINKKEGETPLEALQNFRKKNKKYKDTKITYAGRLDPMAKGLLLLLLGEETKNKEKYLFLPKEYEFDILFGFATDTFDILGKVLISGPEIKKTELESLVKNNLKSFTGTFVQKYPAYSSKTVKGKALFNYAREGTPVVSPEREVYVKKLKFLKIRKVNGRKLLNIIERRINKVQGDFRQKEIIEIWRKNLSVKHHDIFIASFVIQCAGGTYVRGIVDSLGRKIGIPALAFSIKRTRIGKFVKMV